MEQIAFIWHGYCIYRSAIVITLAVVAAMLTALSFRLFHKRSIAPLMLLFPIAILLSFFFARIIHWYCHYRQYSGFASAMTDYSTGAFSLMGVFAGVLLGALLIKAFGAERDLGGLLDDIAPGAAIGIGIGRFSAMFNSYDRGKILIENPEYHKLPWASAVTDAGGAENWRLAVFFWEAVAAFAIFIVLCALCISISQKQSRWMKTYRNGTVFWTFIILYNASEGLLDSMRYDSSFLRVCGFISLVQIIAVAFLLAALIVFSVRSAKVSHFGAVQPICWLIWLCGLGLSGYMEYSVQRHGDLYLRCYTLMFIGFCAACVALFTLMRRTHIMCKPADMFFETADSAADASYSGADISGETETSVPSIDISDAVESSVPNIDISDLSGASVPDISDIDTSFDDDINFDIDSLFGDDFNLEGGFDL